jgi:hypothetical protein
MDGATLSAFEALATGPLFPLEPVSRRVVTAIWPTLLLGAVTPKQTAEIAGCPLHVALKTLAGLAKMGLVRLSAPVPAR